MIVRCDSYFFEQVTQPPASDLVDVSCFPIRGPPNAFWDLKYVAPKEEQKPLTFP